MGLAELFVLAVGLSMDAFAVSICKGLEMDRLTAGSMVTVGAYFGAFQAGMPLIGYCLGSQFQKQIGSVDHWIAFGLLALIGGKMIQEALSRNRCPDSERPEEALRSDVGFRTMLPLAVATSIDALAVGITLAFLQVDMLLSIGLIGAVTFALSAVGVKVGHLFGAKYRSKAEVFGGLILIGIGLKILIEHLGLL